VSGRQAACQPSEMASRAFNLCLRDRDDISVMSVAPRCRSWVNRATADQRRLTQHFRFVPKADLDAEGGQVQRRASFDQSALKQNPVSAASKLKRREYSGQAK
jgi:hypothetical protein